MRITLKNGDFCSVLTRSVTCLFRSARLAVLQCIVYRFAHCLHGMFTMLFPPSSLRWIRVG